ncbi:hypothetical protein FACS189435_0530 [Bacteroidia bacterium]|nr:hypothetical protein FACS189435_0530 [Bacteroidia bacterium]
METNFSLKRAALIWQADWIEYKRGFLLSMGVMFLVWMVLLWLTDFNRQAEIQQSTFLAVGSFVTLILFCQHAGRKMHRTKGMFLTLPAGNAEKYISLLVEGIVYFLGFQLIFWLGILVWKLYSPEMSVISFSAYYLGLPMELVALLLFSASIFFLSYMSFRKRPFLIVMGISAIYGILNIWMLSLVKRLLSGAGHAEEIHIHGSNIAGIKILEQIQLDYMKDTAQILSDYCVPIFLAATVVVMYVAYLKLKEKEQR